MTHVLREYESWELGSDGYPAAWHGKCLCDIAGFDTDLCVVEVCTASEPAIKDLIREEAQNRCERCWHPYEKGMGEWSPCDEKCKHGGETKQVLGGIGAFYGNETEGRLAGLTAITVARYRILTVHHLDENKGNCRWWNLVALCQRCHLSMQKRVVMNRPYHYEHSEWFQPYAAGFYAFKYLGEDLSRAEVMSRLPELLKLEHRFDQGVLL